MISQKTITGLPDENIIARRYAQALFAIGEEQGLEKEFADQLAKIAAALAEDEGRLAAYFSQGRLPLLQQKSLAQEIFAGHIHPLLQNLLFLLLDKGRGGYLPALPGAYQELMDEKAGVLSVTAICPRPFDTEQEAGLTAVIAKLCGKQIRLHQEIDAGLIGGLKLVIDGAVYDGSLARQLDKLEERLLFTPM